uniref:Uncharacterized protein n=1 Tax=Peronospora matthiolae TaxID=2874970 RepID=A0AAV1TIP6_9STRA
MLPSKFSKTDNEEMLVRDVVDILNKKRTSSSNEDREVTRIVLLGVRLNNDIPLSRVICELAGSNPRFVVRTQTPDWITMT